MSLRKNTGRILFNIVGFVLCLIWIAYASDIWADEHKKNEPPVITSDTIEMLEKGKIISFKGNVKLVKGTIIIITIGYPTETPLDIQMSGTIPICVGESRSFTVVPDNDKTTYQWYYN